MKRKLAMTALAGAALAASALAGEDNLLVAFSTPGTDCYADGTPALDGESYALVWTRAGADFAGIAADGRAADPENSAVLCTVPHAEGYPATHCAETVFEIDRALADAYAGAGTFSLHLLDTRRADGTPGGVASGVNAHGAAGAFALAARAMEPGAAKTAPNAALAVEATAVPASVPAPVIKSIEVKGGKVRLTVAATSRLLRYAVRSGESPSSLADDAASARVDGDDLGDIVVEVPASGAGRFFSVGRAPLR